MSVGLVAEPMCRFLVHFIATSWSNLQACKIPSIAEIPKLDRVWQHGQDLDNYEVPTVGADYYEALTGEDGHSETLPCENDHSEALTGEDDVDEALTGEDDHYEAPTDTKYEFAEEEKP